MDENSEKTETDAVINAPLNAEDKIRITAKDEDGNEVEVLFTRG